MLVTVAGLQAQSYDGPDFNGDGISDLGQVWSDNGRLSISVLLSDKTGFTEKKWVSRTGSYDQTQRWFHGDFNGDLLSDTAYLQDDKGRMSCYVYLSTDKNSDFLSDSFVRSAWAVRSGVFAYSDKWFVGDFNGDYKSDLARVYSDNQKRSIDVYLSNGTGFDAPVKWGDKQGNFHPDDVWLTGSFDKTRGMDFAVVEAGSTVNISMYLSSGTAFEISDWISDAGPRLTSMKWVAEDFTGDGVTDIANLWNNGGSVSIDVHYQVEDIVTRKLLPAKSESWAIKSGKFEREHRWFVGDFNGDSYVDIARLWEDNGKLSIESYESDGSTFKPRTLLKQGRTYRDQDVYMVGDFNGDSSTDIAVTWADGTNWHSEVVLSTGGTSTVKPFSSIPLGDYFGRHNLVNPVMGDTFVDYSKLSGATPVGANLQSVLDGGNDLLLVKNKIYNASSMIKYRASYQRIKTMDALFISDYAIIREQIDQGDYDTLISANGQDYIHLENVSVDGNKYKLDQKGKQAYVAQGAMVAISDSEGIWIRRCVLYNARTWSTCQLSEAGRGHIVEHNYVLGAGDDPRGCGRYVDNKGYGCASEISIGWSDGFSIGAANVTARYNFVMDCTDVGIVLFGAPGSHIHDNLILNYSRDNHGGINMVDGIEKWLMGTDSTFGKEYPYYDYRGIIIEDNRIVASGCRIQIGMPFGNRIWKRTKPYVFDMEGGVIRNNILEGDAFGYGYILDYVKNVDFYGNRSIATHSGKGRGTSDNKNDPDPATDFLYDPDNVHIAPDGKLQNGFKTNTKPIEHFLFHNGTPYNEFLYHYYPYTEIEAETIVKASYIEILGREPTAQELTKGRNSFLIDPKPGTLINEAEKQFGDAFKRDLMKLPEFVEKFGPVPTQNLQPLRTARWRDRINANDVAAIMKTGNYADPRKVYDNVLPELVLKPTKADAEIVSVSPSLPKKLAQGQVVHVAVTVRNNGRIPWKNTANNPRKFALASVGNDTTFGATRAYIPDGKSVQPGQKFTFDIEITPPPVAWAGRGKPKTTPFPYDLKMIHESVGYFGETLTEHLGSTHQIKVANVEEPPPRPFYNSTFISQSIQGDPQINGIRPGAKFAVNLTFKNSGNYTSTAWTRAGGFSLGSENTKDNQTWSTNRISLDDTEVLPFGEFTFQAVLTAPSVEGDYNFQWQVLGSQGAGWFGQKSENLIITVSKSAPEIDLIDSQFISIDVPEQVRAGDPFTAGITFKNTGTTSWTAKDAYKLGGIDSFMDRTDEHNVMITSQHTKSISGQSDAQLFDNDTSTKYFTKNASAWVQFQFANSKKYNVVKYVVTSAPDAGPGPDEVTNGSFESGDTGWKLSNSSISTDCSVSGNSCLKLHLLNMKNTGNTTQTITGLKPDTDYVLSFWIKHEPDTRSSFVLDTNDIFDDTCQWVRNGGRPTTWTRYAGVFNTGVVQKGPKNTGSITLRIRANMLVGTIYVDDVSLLEVGGGGALGDPKNWTLQGSNDGTNWTTVDARNGIDFPNRSQRLVCDVSDPGTYEYYKFNATNNSGDTLQFGELELLTDSADRLWTRADRAPMDPGTTVLPGKNYTFKLNLTAPAVPGKHVLRTRMLKEDVTGEGWFGQFTNNKVITVKPSLK